MKILLNARVSWTRLEFRSYVERVQTVCISSSQPSSWLSSLWPINSLRSTKLIGYTNKLVDRQTMNIIHLIRWSEIHLQTTILSDYQNESPEVSVLNSGVGWINKFYLFLEREEFNTDSIILLRGESASWLIKNRESSLIAFGSFK